MKLKFITPVPSDDARRKVYLITDEGRKILFGLFFLCVYLCIFIFGINQISYIKKQLIKNIN